MTKRNTSRKIERNLVASRENSTNDYSDVFHFEDGLFTSRYRKETTRQDQQQFDAVKQIGADRKIQTEAL